MIVDLTMLANLPVVAVPEDREDMAQTPAPSRTPPLRKAPAKPASKRTTKKAPASRRGHEAPEQEEAGEEDRG